MTRDAYVAIHGGLSDPKGFALELTGSLFFYTTHSVCHSSISYFDGLKSRRSADAEFLGGLIRAGWIDTVHAYGDFDEGGFHRDQAVRVAEVCQREGFHFPVFSNHGSDKNLQNVGHTLLTTYQHGDDPEHFAYHLDLTRGIGVDFFWLDSEIAPSVASNEPLMRTVTARDGSRITLFNRYRGLVGRPAPNLQSLPDQIVDSDIDAIIENGATCIYYQHLGVARKHPDGSNDAAYPPYFTPEVTSRLEYIARRQREGACLVAGLGRLLRYIEMRDSISALIDGQTITLGSKIAGLTPQRLMGLTLRVPRHRPVARLALLGFPKDIGFTRTPIAGSDMDAVYIPWEKLDRSVFAS